MTDIVAEAKLEFEKYANKVTLEQFAHIMDDLQILAMEEYDQITQLFNDIDRKRQGHISFQDFKQNLLEEEDDGSNSNSLVFTLTPEQIIDVKTIFKYSIGDKHSVSITAIKRMLENHKELSIKDSDIDEALKAAIQYQKTELTNQEFESIITEYEINLRGNLENNRDAVKRAITIKGGDKSDHSDDDRSSKRQSEARNLIMADYTLEEYITTIEDMMLLVFQTPPEQNAKKEKLLKDTYNYVKILKEKNEKIMRDINDLKQIIEAKDTQEVYLENKIGKLEKAIDKLSTMKEEAPDTAQQLFVIEKEYAVIKNRNVKIDEELYQKDKELNLAIQNIDKMERELTRLKKDNQMLNNKNDNFKVTVSQMAITIQEKEETQKEERKKWEKSSGKKGSLDYESEGSLGLDDDQESPEKKDIETAEGTIEGENKTENPTEETQNMGTKTDKLKILEYKDHIESLEYSVESLTEDNHKIKEHNEDVMQKNHILSSKNKEQELIINELDEENKLLSTRLTNIDIIKRSERGEGNLMRESSLRASYIKIAKVYGMEGASTSPITGENFVEGGKSVRESALFAMMGGGGMGSGDLGGVRVSTTTGGFFSDYQGGESGVLTASNTKHLEDVHEHDDEEDEDSDSNILFQGEEGGDMGDMGDMGGMDSKDMESKENMDSKDMESRRLEEERERADADTKEKKRLEDEVASLKQKLEEERKCREEELTKMKAEEELTKMKAEEELTKMKAEEELTKKKAEEELKANARTTSEEHRLTFGEEGAAHFVEGSNGGQSINQVKPKPEEAKLTTHPPLKKPKLKAIIAEKNKLREKMLDKCGTIQVAKLEGIEKVLDIANFDFLYVRRDTKTLKLLNTYKDTVGTNVFSDYIHIVDHKKSGKKLRNLMFITETYIYVLIPETFKLFKRHKYSIKDLANCIIVTTSANLCAFHFPTQADMLFEVIRRGELLVFLAKQFHKKGFPMFKFDYCSSINMQAPEHKEKVIVDFNTNRKYTVSNQNREIMKNIASTTFVNSFKYGYLEKKAQRLWKTWTEKFCVLTGIGLLYYDDPNKKPRNLFPIIGSTIKPVPYRTFNRNFVFKITAFNLEIIYAARDGADYTAWLKAFSDLQEDYANKREFPQTDTLTIS